MIGQVLSCKSILPTQYKTIINH